MASRYKFEYADNVVVTVVGWHLNEMGYAIAEIPSWRAIPDYSDGDPDFLHMKDLKPVDVEAEGVHAEALAAEALKL